MPTGTSALSSPPSPKSEPEDAATSTHLLAVAELGRELAAGVELETAFLHGMEKLDRRLGIGRAVLYLGDSGRRAIDVEATYGLSHEHFRPRPSVGVVGRVLDGGRPIVVPAVHHDPMALSELSELSEWMGLPWSLISVPVQLTERRLAAFSAYFRQPDSAGFKSRVNVMNVVASLLSQALGPLHGAVSGRSVQPSTSEREPRTVFEYSNMIGASAPMRQVYEQVGQVARTNATALLRGESGTGKELVAHAIHYNSTRSEQPFVKVNCAALPEPLFESELFGHERGAFTGAHGKKKGRFELASGGTLFLDEIGEMSLTTQAKLLRVLQFREFERLGGTETLRTDVRVVAATNQDMETAVANGTFREDLYYRLNVFSITLPPLRDRRADIPALGEYFLAKYAREHGRRITRLSTRALDLLSQHSWPGNVRELENVVERAVVVCEGSVIHEHHLPEVLRHAAEETSTQLTLAEAVARLEKQMIAEALASERGSIARAARMLKTTERVIRYKVDKYAIDLTRFRS